jgi:hypothetical protein
VIADQPWRDDKPGPVVYDQIGPTDIPLDEAGNQTLSDENKP